MTVTQKTTVLGDQIDDGRTSRARNGIDYDDITIGGEEFIALQRESQGLDLTRERSSKERERERVRRTASPTRSMGIQELGGRVAKLSMGPGKASSVAGIARDIARERTSQHEHSRRQSGGGGTKGPPVTTGRNELVQRKVLEDGPERTISLWREDVAVSATASEAGVPATPSAEKDTDGSEVDSHKGRRRKESFALGSPIGLGVPTTIPIGKETDRGARSSFDLTEACDIF